MGWPLMLNPAPKDQRKSRAIPNLRAGSTLFMERWDVVWPVGYKVWSVHDTTACRDALARIFQGYGLVPPCGTISETM